ncbi:MAG: N-6 DNA methylase [Candidatus Aureabacteria bacterium]|nr:N-6 DNA methylase [Candidatus Auribacterota bacterium]
MMDSLFDIAFARVKDLVETFKANEARYLSPDYQEAEARKDFIDKFWIALGWDVNHDVQTNPYEQEVKVERGLSAGGQRRADYAFYLAPNFRDARFFVEAKKPAVQIGTKENHFQVIRYGWNSKTPLGVLTDFEQFHILDCRYKPDISTALDQTVAKYHYSQYSNQDEFAKIYWVFSREAVAAGSLEKRAAELREHRGKAVKRGLLPGGYQSIDESFLQELDEHRTALAHAFKSRNPRLDSETLTEITQRTLDRLVFLRFLEDKGIEPHRHMEKFCEKSGAWEHFITASRRLDGIYNGVVFKQHAILDAPNFHVDADAFAGVCNSLSHTNSPYDFNAIPIHILGSIYERFLGKVIVATDKRVRVEDKPEVRKAGGVYYTPEYIVRYIVENTVGKLIAGKSPKQIAEMKFADISCGSGSFLLGIYDLLLRYHGNYYNAHPKQARKGDCIEHDGKRYLSLRKKREILLNNIYGVDIDAQAVEVCQLSLYLKLLQDETTASAHEHQMEFHETLLPPLNKNIVCGNSLIGTDILEDQLFPGDEERKLNPMNFEDAFPEVMKRGGFDAIVGNPPYIQLSMEAFKNEAANNYIRKTYKFSGGRLNTFAFFIERARQKVHEAGKFAYIVPNTVLSQEYYEDLRKKLIQYTDINTVAMPEGQIFKDAVVESVVLVLTKHTRQQEENPKGKVEFVTLYENGLGCEHASVVQSELAENYKASFITPLNPEIRIIRTKLEKNKENFGRWLNINQAIALKHDRAACLTDHKKTASHREVLDGRHISRYLTGTSPNYFKFDVSKIHSCKREDIFLLPEKIFFRRVGDSLIASLDTQKKFALNTLVVMSPKPDSPYNLRYVLALMNSKLLNFYYVNFLKSSKKVFSEIQAHQVEQLPFPSLDLSKKTDKEHYYGIIQKVEAMLEAKKQLAKAKTDKDKTYYENKCAGLDHQIDRLVYDLYGLTDEEIKIVEDHDR